jgi:fructose-bisphosphate aldolase class I
MNKAKLIDTANALMGGDKGLLAMDESNATCNKRFAPLGIPQTPEARRLYRDLIVTTPGLGECLSGAILFDETVRQRTNAGQGFSEALAAAGIIPGIKVDKGAKDIAGHPGEKVTEGLDGLGERLAEYAGMGLRFAKWRAVITIGDGLPSRACLEVNAHALARYAALCQQADIVPIVEPEVLMDGDHPMEQCAEATDGILQATFAQIRLQGVLLEGMILKPNMVVSGLACPRQASVDEVAEATLACFARNVPAAVAGIAFLSGGQSSTLASARLSAMNVLKKSPGARAPWPVTFSYSRAIQQPALETWRGDPGKVAAAQKALLHRSEMNRLARRGEYRPEKEAA